MLKRAAILKSDGNIITENGGRLHWSDLSELLPPELPPSMKIELILTFKENELLLGNGGFVWATFSASQAEIIQSTLLAQHINSELKEISAVDRQLFALKIVNASDIEEAVNFIWQSPEGLRLKPDWVYPSGEKNLSFEQWLGGQ